MDSKLSIHIYPAGSMFRQAWLIVKRGNSAIDSQCLGYISEHEARKVAAEVRTRHLPAEQRRDCPIISYWESGK